MEPEVRSSWTSPAQRSRFRWSNFKISELTGFFSVTRRYLKAKWLKDSFKWASCVQAKVFHNLFNSCTFFLDYLRQQQRRRSWGEPSVLKRPSEAAVRQIADWSVIIQCIEHRLWSFDCQLSHCVTSRSIYHSMRHTLRCSQVVKLNTQTWITKDSEKSPLPPLLLTPSEFINQERFWLTDLFKEGGSGQIPRG